MYCNDLQVLYNGSMKKPRVPGRRKSTALMIRLSQEQSRRFKQHAARLGLSTSGWARMILLHEAKAK
jgi:predicted HicB family RNase H-like nuclease